MYVVAADGTGAVRNLTPGPFQHDGVTLARRFVGGRDVGAAPRHWDRDLCEDLYVVPLDGEVRALTKQTGQYLAPSVSPDGTLRRLPRSRRPDDVSAERQGRRGRRSTGGDHRWVSAALDRTFTPTAGVRPPVWLDDDTLLATAEDRGETHLYRARRRRVVAAGTDHQWPPTDPRRSTLRAAAS